MRAQDKTCAKLIEFEERASALYRKLAARFRTDERLSWFWVEMSMEEKRHSGFLEFCAAENLITCELPDDAIQRLSKLFQKLEKQAASQVLSVDAAFLIAAELETSQIDDFYKQLVSPVKGSSYILRRKIETTIAGHAQVLLRNAERFGVSQSTLSRIREMDRTGARGLRQVSK